ncbi:S-adenosyl-L-methionine-dependent methyltransferase [Wilcoxina mikolae CBS 423.85]|nr:S-adenosyl-L-methionine-dependent methyltransferase [Wilcoxina mikolae CBS 423.85]
MTQAPETIEVDPAVLRDPEDDSYASSGYDTSTASLTSSVNEYIVENGRRYHTYWGPDKNPHPTDEKEQDRLDMHHEIMLLLLGRQLYKAPIGDSPQRILDVGTGTGIWAIDMADQHPSAEVIGMDLSPIQPKWVPPNCRFEVDDAELEWTYPVDSFDFIHVRNISQAVSDWPRLLAQCHRCCKPGGYIELAEIGLVAYSDDNTLPPGITRYLELLREGLVKLGRPHVTGETLKDNLAKAGFVDIQIHSYKQPFAPWPKNLELKRIGAMFTGSLQTSGFHAYGMSVFTRILGIDAEEADKICCGAVQSARNKNNHTYNY